jgi:hypothetical protein
MNQQKLLEKIEGTWRLVSAVRKFEDGEIADRLGPGATGFLTYTPDGYMSAQLQAADRPLFQLSDPLDGTPAELASAASGYISYCGRYSVDESTQTITHEIAISLFPNWAGQHQKRIARFSGNQLILSTLPTLSQGRRAISELIWERPQTP